MRRIERILVALALVSSAGVLATARGETTECCPSGAEAQPEAYAPELPPPNVVIVGSAALQGSVALTGEGGGCPFSSEDWPFSCVPVEIGPLSVEVHLQTRIPFEEPESPLPPTPQPTPPKTVCVQLFVDGQPVSGHSHELVAQHADDEKLAAFTIPCPKPGRHFLQARYRVDNRWSPLSRILCIDVRLPKAPEIIAVGDWPHTLNPVPGKGAVTITGSRLSFRLADCQCAGVVAAYLDGAFVGEAEITECTARARVDISQYVPPGYYELTVRSYGPGRLASPPSRAVSIHYQPEAGYLYAESPRRSSPSASRSLDPGEPPQDPEKAADAQRPASADSPETRTLDAPLAAARLIAAEEAYKKAKESLAKSRDSAERARKPAADQAAEAERAANAHASALAKRDLAIQRETEAKKDAAYRRSIADTAAGAGRGDAAEMARLANEAWTRAERAAAGRDSAEKELADAAAVLTRAKIAAAETAEAAQRAEKKAEADAAALRAAAERRAALAAHLANMKRDAANEALGEVELWSWLGAPAGYLRDLKADADKMIKAAADAELEAQRRAADLPGAPRAVREASAPPAKVAGAAAPEGQPEARSEKPDTAVDGAPGPEGAFRFIPKPHRIPMEGETPGEEGEQGDALNNPRMFRFLSTAHFPRRDFGPHGGVYDRTGALIYEGMQFAAGDAGKYEVDFVVGAPAVPAVLHLQFLVREANTGRWQTVTLPPIEIQPSKGSDGRYQPGIWRVRHQGYSAALDHLNGSFRVVRREGSARFGFGPALVRAQQ